jgi:hypothetical protein
MARISYAKKNKIQYMKNLPLRLFNLWLDIQLKWLDIQFYVRSRYRIISLKVFPPTKEFDYRLEYNPEFLETIPSEKHEAYFDWIQGMRNKLHQKEISTSPTG